MAGAVNSIGQSKRGGGDRSSRPAELQAAAGFGIATASGAWRSVHRALAQIPKQEADQAREDGGRYAGTGTAAARP